MVNRDKNVMTKLYIGLDSIKEVSVGDSIDAIEISEDKDGSTPKEPHILTDKL